MNREELQQKLCDVLRSPEFREILVREGIRVGPCSDPDGGVPAADLSRSHNERELQLDISDDFVVYVTVRVEEA